MSWRKMAFPGVSAIILILTVAAQPALAKDRKPLNFLMIFGDDIGCWNISAYNMGG